MATPPRKPPFTRTQLIVLVVGALVAVNLLVFGVVIGAETGEPERPSTLPEAVESTQPALGELVRPQTPLAVDLDDRYTGVLFVEGEELPLDQLEFPGNGRIVFQPGPGQEVERFREGIVNVSVEFWDATQERSEGTSRYNWFFRVG